MSGPAWLKKNEKKNIQLSRDSEEDPSMFYSEYHDYPAGGLWKEKSNIQMNKDGDMSDEYNNYNSEYHDYPVGGSHWKETTNIQMHKEGDMNEEYNNYNSEFHDYPTGGAGWQEKANVQLGFEFMNMSENQKKLINLLQQDDNQFDYNIYEFMDSSQYVKSEQAAVADQIVNVEFSGGIKKEDE